MSQLADLLKRIEYAQEAARELKPSRDIALAITKLEEAEDRVRRAISVEPLV
ncbi:hypothetical protein [Rhizobium phage RHph_X3_15]|nr:hypothetical protein [Rhizobium phage RHph_X3_15]